MRDKHHSSTPDQTAIGPASRRKPLIQYRFILQSSLLLALGLGTAGNAFAQSAESATTDDPIMRPTEAGIRATPEMARGVAHLLVDELFVRQFELDESKRDEAADMVARRIMEGIHATDGQIQPLIEGYMAAQMRSQFTGGRRGFVPPEYAPEFAERAREMVPVLRQTVADISRDMRPMMPFKKQLQLAAGITAFNTGLDAFEQTLDKWATGEVDNTVDPFRTHQEQTFEKEQDGTTPQLKNARKQAAESAESTRARNEADRWTEYVEDAKAYYQFDEAQNATADSVLREYTDRLFNLTRDETWKRRYQRARLWEEMLFNLPRELRSCLREMLVSDELEQLNEPITDLRNEMKRQIDAIATVAQRTAATERIHTLLEEKGIPVHQRAEVDQ